MEGNNPVHLAAINGYTNTMVAILSIHSHLVNAENRDGVSTHHFVSVSCFLMLEYLLVFELGKVAEHENQVHAASRDCYCMAHQTSCSG